MPGLEVGEGEKRVERTIRIVTPSTPVFPTTPSTVELAKILDPYRQEQEPQPVDIGNASSPLIQDADPEASSPKCSNDISRLVIRRARVTDLPAMADVLAKAFWDEDAVGRFMHPKREQHPRDFMRYWRRRAARGMCDWQREAFVATLKLDDLDSTGGQVIGVVEWSDYSGKDAEKGAKWVSRKFHTLLDMI
jgi:hypothetical protein